MCRIEQLETELAALVHDYTDHDRPRLDAVLTELGEARVTRDATRLP